MFLKIVTLAEGVSVGLFLAVCGRDACDCNITIFILLKVKSFNSLVPETKTAEFASSIDLDKVAHNNSLHKKCGTAGQNWQIFILS